MPSESIPLDRKDFFKERKHERFESPARWRDSSSHYGSREFNRWGSAEFRRPAGHGKQGGWHLFPEDSGHGYVPSRSSDRVLEEDVCRQAVSRGDGKYGRSNRENRGSFSQRDWRGHSWETASGSLRRQPDVNGDQRFADDVLTYSTLQRSDFVNTWEQHQPKDQHNKMGGVNGSATGQRYDRESSLGSIDWKPLKWTRSGNLSTRGLGFNHSSSSRSIRRADSCERKPELQHKTATAVESNSREAAAHGASSAPSEETNSRKKPRLNWGEGLAKFEKKKVEGPDISADKDGPILSPINMDPSNIVGDKNPKVTRVLDCASPATPSSVACSSSPGVDDKLSVKAANVDNDFGNLSGSPGPGTPNPLPGFSFELEKVDIDSLTSLGSSLVELLQSDDPSSVDSSLARSTAINKLLIWKADISKVLEVTETEIDLLENELKSLKSESEDRFQCSAAASSLLVCFDTKFSDEEVGGTDRIVQPEPLQIVSSDDDNVEKMPLSTTIRDNGKEDDIDSPGTATSKFVEPQSLIKSISSCDAKTDGTCMGNLDESTATKCIVPCTYRKVASKSACGDGNSVMEIKDGRDSNSSASFYSTTEDILYNTIISSNKESAKRACEVFAKLLPKESGKIGNIGVSGSSRSHNAAFIKEKFLEKKRFARFKEKVLTIKFKALQHLWKEDMRLQSTRKSRPKSHKRIDLGLRTFRSCHQKNRSSIRSRFPFPAGNQLSLVPTSEMINYTSQLLSEFQNKVHRNALKMPALILDQREKMISRFISSNGLVEDPLAIEKEKATINPWTSEERAVFLEKYATFGKDFPKIASFLEHKTTADCIEFYYKNHKSDCFEKIKKKNGGKLGKFTAKTDLMASGAKWNCEANVASFEILSAASVMTHGIAGNRRMGSRNFLLRGYDRKTSIGDDNKKERSSSHDILPDERETVAADVLAGIYGSLSSEAMSSVDPLEVNRDRKGLTVRPPSQQPVTPEDAWNIDDETCSDESSDEIDPSDWTDEEKAALLQAVQSFGKDFAMMAQCVGTRSRNQCKIFFSKARKCLRLDIMRPRAEYTESIENNDVNGGRSDTDDACIVETDSVVGSDKSGTKTDEDLPSSVMNTYHDESNPVEARDLSGDINESKEMNGEVDHADVNMVSKACVIKGESELGTDCSGCVLYSSDKSGSVKDQTGLIMSDSIEIRKDEVGDTVTELVSASEVTEPCHCHSVTEDRLVSEELGGSPTSLNDRDGKQEEANTDVVAELKNRIHDSCTTADTSLSSVGFSCSRLTLGAENQPQLSLEKPQFSRLSVEDPFVAANMKLQNTAGAAVQQEKATTTQDQLSSTCDFHGVMDMSGHISVSNAINQLDNPGNLDNVEPTRNLHCSPSQVPVRKEVNMDMSCCTSANALLLLSQKIEQTGDHYKTQLQSDSERTARNGDVKLFGKILTNPSSTLKLNLTTKAKEENGTHHAKLSSSSSLKTSAHHNADEKLPISKFNCTDHQGPKNVSITNHHDGNRVQSGLSSVPDSAILLAKFPAAFSNYSTPAKIEHQSLPTLDENNEQHRNGASAFTTREVNGGNSVIDFQMFGNREGVKVQPFMVDAKHCPDVFSGMPQRINGLEAISCLQQQGVGMAGMNGVGRPDVPYSGVSDPVAALKMHYSIGNQSGSMTREDESWGGKEGNLGR